MVRSLVHGKCQVSCYNSILDKVGSITSLEVWTPFHSCVVIGLHSDSKLIEF